MLRKVCSVLTSNILPLSSVSRQQILRNTPLSTNFQPLSHFSSLIPKTFSAHQNLPLIGLNKFSVSNTLLESKVVTTEQIRTVTKFSWKSGTKKTVPAVKARFLRLRWGGWIRVLAGRHHHIWKKSARERTRALQHFMVTHKQAIKLEKMTTRLWRRPRYYPEDPYEPYHNRDYYYATKRKPFRPEGVDYE